MSNKNYRLFLAFMLAAAMWTNFIWTFMSPDFKLFSIIDEDTVYDTVFIYKDKEVIVYDTIDFDLDVLTIDKHDNNDFFIMTMKGDSIYQYNWNEEEHKLTKLLVEHKNTY